MEAADGLADHARDEITTILSGSPQIGSDWDPRGREEEDNISRLIREAQECGAIVVPRTGSIEIDFVRCGAYRWIVSAPGLGPALATDVADRCSLGDTQTRGAAAARAILADAVEVANTVCDALDRYARAAAYTT
jgi:hypothetical protein